MNYDNVCIKLGTASLAFILFVFPAVSRHFATKSFYSEHDYSNSLYVSVSLLVPNRWNKCDYNYVQNGLETAIPSRIADSYTCCDWAENLAPAKIVGDQIHVLCGEWPHNSVIAIDSALIET